MTPPLISLELELLRGNYSAAEATMNPASTSAEVPAKLSTIYKAALFIRRGNVGAAESTLSAPLLNDKDLTPLERALKRRCQGEAFAHKGEYGAALGRFRAGAGELEGEPGAEFALATLYLSSTDALVQLGQTAIAEEALAAAERALAGGTEHLLVGVVMRERAQIQLVKGEADAARKNAESALLSFDDAPLQAALTHNLLALISTELCDVEAKLTHRNAALECLLKCDDRSRVRWFCQQLAETFVSRGQRDSAEEALSRSDMPGLAPALAMEQAARLGTEAKLDAMRGDLASARSKFTAATQKAEAAPALRAELHLAHGQWLLLFGKTEEAIVAFDRARSCAVIAERAGLMRRVVLATAEALAKAGAMSESNAQLAEFQSQRDGGAQLALACQLRRVQALHARVEGNHERACVLLDRALGISVALEDTLDSVTTRIELTRTLLALGNEAGAFAVKRKTRDSLVALGLEPLGEALLGPVSPDEQSSPTKPIAAPPTDPAALCAAQVMELMSAADSPRILVDRLVEALGDHGVVARPLAAHRPAPAELAKNPKIILGRTAVYLSAWPEKVEAQALLAVAQRLGSLAQEKEVRSEEEEALPDAGLVFASRAIEAIIRRLWKVRASQLPVLITGESGVGKELIAKAVHTLSVRARAKFIPFNCATVSRELLASSLFGHKKGSFTGADKDAIGVIRAAEGGTLFLDEVGELPTELQAHLLRFLENGEVLPVGESTPRIVDVRIVAATNRNLMDQVAQGKFREDLYYRLHVINVEIPSLRERPEDIPVLARFFLDRAAQDQKTPLQFADEALGVLGSFSFPGNVRQLKHTVERLAVVSADTGLVTAQAVAEEIGWAKKANAGGAQQHGSADNASASLAAGRSLQELLDEFEGEVIGIAIREAKNISSAAKLLRVSRSTLYEKMKRLGIES